MSDETAICVAGISMRDPTTIYIREVIKGRWGFPDLVEAVKHTYDYYKGKVLAIEKAASGQSLIQVLKKEARIPVEEMKPLKSKTTRLQAVCPLLESGRVKALKGYAGAAIDLKEVFGDLTDKLTAADKAQAMYALIMIHGTKLQHAQTKEVDETADALTRFETRLKNSLDTLKGYVAKAAGLFAQVMEWSYKTDRRYKFVAGQDRPQPKTGPVKLDDPLAEYKQQLAELVKFYKARQDAENADKKAGKQAAREAAEAVKEAEREKQEAIDLTTKAIAAEYEAVDQIIKDVKAGAQESLDSIIKQFEEVSRLYDDMTAKIEAANQQTIMGAFAGTGMGGPMGDLMSIISDTSVFDEAISTIEEYYSRRGDLASDLAAKEAAIEQANWQKKTAMVSYGFASMSALAQAFYNASNQRSKAAFTLYKAFAAAEATVDTYRAAQASYAWGAKFGGPPLGAAMAAIAMAAGLARVAAIVSQNMGGSVSSVAGGTGSGEVPTTTVDEKPTTTTPEMTSRGQSINIYVEGNLVNHEAFAREILPALLKAQSDNVR